MTVRTFSSALFRHAPRRALGVLSLSVVSGLTEGVGLLLLIPLLALVGLPMEGGVSEGLQTTIQGGFGAVGLPLELGEVLLVFLAVIAVRAFLQWWSGAATAALEHRFGYFLRDRLYRAIFGAKWSVVVRERIPDLTHALTMDVERAAVCSVLLTRLLAAGVLSTVYVVFALLLAPWITLMAIVLGLGLVALGRRWNLRVRRVGEEFTTVGQGVSAAVQDYLGALKTAKSYGAEKRSIENFSHGSRRLMGVSLSSERTFAAASSWMSFSAAALLCALVYGAVQFFGMPVATLLLLILIFARVIPRVLSLQSGFHHLLNALPGYENVMGLIHRLEAEGGDDVNKPPEKIQAPAGIERGVGLEGVTFGYIDGGSPVLDGVSLQIPAGKTTALVGASGAGKTTIADLVLGLLTPDEGLVVVDGAPLSPSTIPAWRSRIGYVSQDGALLPDSIRNNLLWAHPGAGEEAMWEALGLAAAEGFVRGLPQGLDTVVGERGSLLSGGERQRLALAGALVRKPSLLVLDEATSAMDAANERRVLEALYGLRGETTVLLISHRLSAVRNADLFHVLHNGRNAESGSWQELMALRGRFYGNAVLQGVTSPDEHIAPKS